MNPPLDPRVITVLFISMHIYDLEVPIRVGCLTTFVVFFLKYMLKFMSKTFSITSKCLKNQKLLAQKRGLERPQIPKLGVCADIVRTPC